MRVLPERIGPDHHLSDLVFAQSLAQQSKSNRPIALTEQEHQSWIWLIPCPILGRLLAINNWGETFNYRPEAGQMSVTKLTPETSRLIRGEVLVRRRHSTSSR